MSMSTQSEISSTVTDPIKAYAQYPFDEDETYQQGLASILAGSAIDPSSAPEEKEGMIRKTRVFYFNKVKGHAITLDEARDYELSSKQTNSPPTSSEPSSGEDENRVLTFAELKELIETGNVDKIPNNKVIPGGLNDAPPSESTAPSRKKPWEKLADQ